MKRGLIFLFLALLILSTVFAALPYPGKCDQIGFKQNITHCFLPDDSACTLDEFEEGSCGQEYQKDFCVEKGISVWRNQGFECCGDMEPYLPPEMLGQTSCQDVSDIRGFTLWPFILRVVLTLVIVYIIWLVLKRRRK